MRSNLAIFALIFVSAQASAVMNALDKTGPIGALIRKSAVNLVDVDSYGDHNTRCSSVLVGRRYVLTAFHCVGNGGSLWHEAPWDRKRVVEFLVKGSKKPKYIKVKSIDYPQALKSIHEWGRGLYRLMADMEDKVKNDIAVEMRMNLVIRLGGDVKAVPNYSGESNQEFDNYLKTLLSTRPEEEQRALFEEFMKGSDSALEERIVSATLPALNGFLKEHGYNEGYEAFEKFVRDLDLALLTLDQDAPAEYSPVKIGAADLREGSDLKGWIAGSGAFGNIGDEKFQRSLGPGLKKIRLGTVKIESREDRHFNLRANPSRICHGDSGGPLYVKDGKNIVLVGIHSAVNYANDQERKNGESQCTADVPTVSIELLKFKDFLKPVL